MNKHLSIFLLFFGSHFLFAIDQDSLLAKANEVLYSNPKKAIALVEPVLTTGNKEQVFDACYLVADSYYLLGDLKMSQLYYNRSLKIAEELDDDDKRASAYLGIGTTYSDMGESDKGLDYLKKSLDIRERKGDKEAVANVLNNIAVLFSNQGNYNMAIKYMSKVVAIDREREDSISMGISYSNLGAFHYYNNNNDSALYYHQLALKIRTGLGDELQQGRTLNNIANVLIDLGKMTEGIATYKRALEIKRKYNNQYEISFVLHNLGESLVSLKKYEEALPYLLEANKILDSLNEKVSYVNNAYTLATAHFNLGDHKKAYLLLDSVYHQRFRLFEEERSKQTQEMMAKFETEQTEKENEELRAQSAEDALFMEKSKNRVYLLVGGLSVSGLLALLILSKLRTNRKNTRILKELYDQLEQKNTDIVDSINYAQRIQKAILPPEQEVKSLFPKSFVFYRPKDVVAGDFYWIEQQENQVMLAAADCTGHGVPGAMVSVICNNALNRAVREFNLTDPGEILDKTRDIVLEEFEKSEEDVKDGMDIALCSLSFESNSNSARVAMHGNAKLQYAGANNPLWIIRKNKPAMKPVNVHPSPETKVDIINNYLLIDVKADKQPIGKFQSAKSFQTRIVELNPGDTIYIFSDGYADQFGGEKGKKFKASNFKSLLVSLQHLSMDEQMVELNKSFQAWKGSLEQLDDVCVIGVRM
ncbi:MAG: tetratricopeptide repeat protein [Crocinitomicaceae bacterium]